MNRPELESIARAMVARGRGSRSIGRQRSCRCQCFLDWLLKRRNVWRMRSKTTLLLQPDDRSAVPEHSLDLMQLTSVSPE